MLRDGSAISGAPVPSIEPVRQGGDAGIAASSAERRQLTVLFCDLVGQPHWHLALILKICGRCLALIMLP